MADVEAVRHASARLARYTDEAAATNAQLKQTLRQHVYNSEMVLDERQQSTAKVAELFEYLSRIPKCCRSTTSTRPAVFPSIGPSATTLPA